MGDRSHGDAVAAPSDRRQGRRRVAARRRDSRASPTPWSTPSRTSASRTWTCRTRATACGSSEGARPQQALAARGDGRFGMKVTARQDVSHAGPAADARGRCCRTSKAVAGVHARRENHRAYRRHALQGHGERQGRPGEHAFRGDIEVMDVDTGRARCVCLARAPTRTGSSVASMDLTARVEAGDGGDVAIWLARARRR